MTTNNYQTNEYHDGLLTNNLISKSLCHRSHRTIHKDRVLLQELPPLFPTDDEFIVSPNNTPAPSVGFFQYLEVDKID